MTATVKAGDASLPVDGTAGFATANGIWIERAGTNEEQTTVIGVGTGTLQASVSIGHPSGSFVTRKTKAWHVAQKAVDLKREIVAGQERVVWNPALAIPAKEFEFTDAEVTRINATLQTWDSYGVGADRRWLEPLLDAIPAGAPELR